MDNKFIYLTKELMRLSSVMVDIVENPYIEWKRKYEIIFTDTYYGKWGRLVPGFDWYDPDTSYEEDVCSFVYACKDFIDNK